MYTVRLIWQSIFRIRPHARCVVDNAYYVTRIMDIGRNDGSQKHMAWFCLSLSASGRVIQEDNISCMSFLFSSPLLYIVLVA